MVATTRPPAPDPTSTQRRRRSPRLIAAAAAVGLLASSLAGVIGIVTPSAQAAAVVTLAKTAPATVLYGSTSGATLTASNAPGNDPLFNASFRDVLPVGVTLVSGTPAPTKVIANQPSAGRTTLLWENIGDIQPGASLAVSYVVSHTPGNDNPANPIHAGDTFTNGASVFAHDNPRYVPDFDVNGAAVAGATSYSTTANASANTQVVPIRITKDEPSPEAELLRGIHDHTTVYTLTVTNNSIAATNTVVVDDFLPASLEFLGCGGADNTPALSGRRPEYPGAALLSATPPPPAPCPTPTLVDTVTNPIGKPNGVYTQVRWSIGNMTPGQVTQIRYRAGIPLRANTSNFPTEGRPTAASGAQGSNLDNNTGPLTIETGSEGSVTNYASAGGTYAGFGGATAFDQTTATRTMEDLAIQKSIASGGSEAQQGAAVVWELMTEVSEYRTVSNTVVTDTIPDGYEYTPGSARIRMVSPTPTAPVAFEPVATLPGGGLQVLTWTLTSAPTPFDATLPANTVFAITFGTQTLTNYRATGQPIAAFDALTNTVAITGASTATPSVGALDGTTQVVNDASSAGQSSSWTGVQKTLAWGASTPPALGCKTPSNAASVPPQTARFVPGDTVCYRLVVNFPATMQLKNTKVADFIPPNSTYLNWAPNPGNTVTTGSIDTSLSPDQVFWNVGDTVGANKWTGKGETFDVTLSTRITTDPNANNSFDLVQNLLKVTSANTPGSTTSLRDMTDISISEPIVDLAKGVKSINATPTPNGNRPDNGNGPATGRADGGAVLAGTAVVYRVDVTNTGPTNAATDADATTVQVVDRLPAQTDCTDVSLGTIPRALAQSANDGDPFAIPNPARTGQPASNVTAGSCTAGLIRWTIDQVPSGFSVELTYTLTIPTGSRQPVTGEVLTNSAGVSSYQGPRGDAPGHITYVPTANVDPAQAATPKNAPAANDDSFVSVPGPTFTKTRTTEITETGNNTASQATWGENVTYTVDFSIPAGVSAKTPIRLTDPLPSSMEYVPGTTTVRWGKDGTANAVTGCSNVDSCTFATSSSSPSNPSFTLTTGPTITLATTAVGGRYDNPVGVSPTDDDVFQLVFTARLKTGARGATVTNTAVFTYVDVLDQTVTRNAAVNTTIVGPNVSAAKAASTTSNLRGGDTITYTVTFTNSGSPLHDATVTDCVPAGLVPVAGTPITTSALPSPAVAGVIGSPGACAAGGTPITWTLPGAYALTSSASLTARYDVTVVGANQTLGAGAGVQNTVRIDGDSYPGTPTLVGSSTGDTPASATANRTVSMRNASITKSVTPSTRVPGALAAYTVTVTLPRGLRAYDMTVVDSLPAKLGVAASPTPQISAAGCTPFNSGSAPYAVTAGANQLGWFLGDISTPDSATDCVVTITYSAYPTTSANRDDVLQNSVALRWNDTNKVVANPTAVPTPTWDRSASTTASITVIEPVLAITKTTDDLDGNVDPGQVVTYSIQVTNTGNATAYDITVVDDLPPGMQAPATISDGGVYTAASAPTPARLTWNLFTSTTGLAPSASITLTYTQRVNSATALGAAGTLVNVADITEFFADDTHTGPGFKTYDGPSSSRTLNTQVPVLTIAKTVADGSELGMSEIGQDFIWRVTVTNTGNGTAMGVDVSDVLPPDWTYTGNPAATTAGPAGCTPSVASPNVTGTTTVTIAWTDVCNLPAGASFTLSFTAQPTLAAIPAPYVPGTQYTNTATASASDTGGDPIGTVNDTARATIRAADLRVVKSDANATFVIGNTGHYTIDVTNLGPNTEAGPVTVSDTLPAGLELAATPVAAAGAGLSWSCTGTAGDTSFVCTLQGIPVNGLGVGQAIRSIDVPVRVLESALPGGASGGVTVTNTAVVAGTTYDKDPTNNSEPEDTPLARIADHEVVKSLTAGTPAGGADLTYTFTVTNLGPSPSTGTVTLSDPLPLGLRLMSVTPGSGWDCSASVVGTGYTPATNGNLACTRATNLAPAGTPFPIVQIVARIDPASTSPATIVNIATITAPNDPNPANDTSQVNTGTTPSANLTIQKNDGGATFEVGQPANYTIRVTNAGPTNEVGPVTVTDPLPVGLRLVGVAGTGAPSAWDCTASTIGTGFTAGTTGSVSCTHTPTLADPFTAGEFLDLIDVQVAVGQNAAPNADPLASNSVTNVATVTGVTDTTPSSSTVVTPIRRVATLAIDKRHDGTTEPWLVGSRQSFEIVVSNTGPSPEYGPITVSDTLPTGLSLVSVGGGGWSCATVSAQITCAYNRPGGTPVGSAILAAGASLPVITVTVDVLPSAAPLLAPQLNSVSNTASVVGITDPVSRDDTDVVPIRPVANLSVEKSHTGALFVGTDVTFTLQVRNAGPSVAAAPITVVDTLPTGLTYVSGTGTGWTCAAAGQVVTCTSATDVAALGALPPIELAATLGVEAELGVTNTATVTSPTFDPDTTDNTDTDPLTAIPSSDLVIDKTHDGPEMYVGVPGVWRLAVRNAGPSVNAGAITVDDPLPAGLTLVSAVGDGWDCSTSTSDRARCTRPGPAAVGEALPVITVTVSIPSSIVPAGQADITLDNVATVTSPVHDPTPSDNVDTDPTKIIAAADLTITKTHDPAAEATAIVGTDLTFTVQVSNLGPAPAGGDDPVGPISVVDTMPTELMFAAGGGNGWMCVPVAPGTLPEQIRCTHPARVAPGASWPPLTITTRIVGVGVAVNGVEVFGRTPDLVPGNNRATDRVPTVVIPLSVGPSPGPSPDGRTPSTSAPEATASVPAAVPGTAGASGPADETSTSAATTIATTVPVTAPPADGTSVGNSRSQRDVGSSLLSFTGDHTAATVAVASLLLALGAALTALARRRREAE